MAERPQILTIVDRIIELAKGIDGDEITWRVAVKSVGPFRGASDLDLPRPAVLVAASADEGGIEGMSNGFYETPPLALIGLVHNSTNPQDAAHELAGALKRLVRENPTINAADGTRLATDWRETGTAVVSVDPDRTGSGGAQVTVPTRLQYVTTNEAT